MLVVGTMCGVYLIPVASGFDARKNNKPPCGGCSLGLLYRLSDSSAGVAFADHLGFGMRLRIEVDQHAAA